MWVDSMVRIVFGGCFRQKLPDVKIITSLNLLNKSFTLDGV